MCLYVRDKEPRVAKRDIVVLKYLWKENERFYSPWQNTPVTIGEMLVAYPDEPSISRYSTDNFGREISTICGGAIHARLFEDYNYTDYSNYCAKAIIPKGTKYWVDPFGREIAAERMLITKEAGNDDILDDSFAREILESAPEINGIRIGDYQMTDDSFIHPKKSIAKTKVRGIVCGFYKNGKPIICALEMFKEVWDCQGNSKVGEYGDPQVAMKLFNGKRVTRKYIQKGYKDKSRFGAFERCINYRKNKGEEWFFGALGENMTMLDNAIYLNAANKITGLGCIFDTNYLYWSCSEDCSNDFALNCYLYRIRVSCSMERKSYICRVVPFYAFNGISKQKEKKKL